MTWVVAPIAPTNGADARSWRLGAYGVPEFDVARVASVDPKTLRKRYRDELDLGATKATAKVAEFPFRKATTKGPQCVTAAILWMKTRGGWPRLPSLTRVAFKPASKMTERRT